MESIEVKYNSLLSENAALTRIVRQLKTALHQAQIDHAATKRQHILMGSGLSEQSRERLNAAFNQSTDNSGLKEAVKVEKRCAQ